MPPGKLSQRERRERRVLLESAKNLRPDLQQAFRRDGPSPPALIGDVPSASTSKYFKLPNLSCKLEKLQLSMKWKDQVSTYLIYYCELAREGHRFLSNPHLFDLLL